MKRKYSETFEETQSRKKYRILKEEVEKLFTSLFFKFLYNSLLMNFDNITRWLLVDVNISNNKIDVLPRKLGALHCLQRLDLSHNCLSRLYGWTWLKEKHIKRTLCFLDISHNSVNHILPELSSHIWKLNALVELKISHNWLEHLPENIQNAQNLRILDLSHNFLKYLPAKIIYLELQTLDVSMNPFAKKWECDILVPSLAQFAAKTLEQYCRERQVIFQFDVINEYVARNATHNCYYCENICTSPYVYATRALKPILEVAINVIKETPDMPVVLFEFCFCFPCKDKDY